MGMKRVTQRLDSGLIMYIPRSGAKSVDFSDPVEAFKNVQDILTELEAYEDLGYTPEELKALIDKEINLQKEGIESHVDITNQKAMV